jgi:hypothetical protein
LLTINSAAPGSALNQSPVRPQNLIWPSAGGTALAMVFFVLVPRRRRNWLTLAMLLGLAVSLSTIGCTGGNGKKGGPGTTTGSYTVAVTGTSGSTSVPLSTVQVTIQ